LTRGHRELAPSRYGRFPNCLCRATEASRRSPRRLLPHRHAALRGAVARASISAATVGRPTALAPPDPVRRVRRTPLPCATATTALRPRTRHCAARTTPGSIATTNTAQKAGLRSTCRGRAGVRQRARPSWPLDNPRHKRIRHARRPTSRFTGPARAPWTKQSVSGARAPVQPLVRPHKPPTIAPPTRRPSPPPFGGPVERSLGRNPNWSLHCCAVRVVGHTDRTRPTIMREKRTRLITGPGGVPTRGSGTKWKII
jgi:hypothetical protein